MQVMRVTLVLHGDCTGVVGLAIGPAIFDTTTCKPESKATIIVATSFLVVGQRCTCMTLRETSGVL
jgi:hypothetical protein